MIHTTYQVKEIVKNQVEEVCNEPQLKKGKINFECDDNEIKIQKKENEEIKTDVKHNNADNSVLKVVKEDSEEHVIDSYDSFNFIDDSKNNFYDLISSQSSTGEDTSLDIELPTGNGILNDEILRSYDTKITREDGTEFKVWCKYLPYHGDSIARIEDTSSTVMKCHYLSPPTDEEEAVGKAYFYENSSYILTTREWNILDNHSALRND